jgi:hypothetical protein
MQSALICVMWASELTVKYFYNRYRPYFVEMLHLQILSTLNAFDLKQHKPFYSRVTGCISHSSSLDDKEKSCPKTWNPQLHRSENSKMSKVIHFIACIIHQLVLLLFWRLVTMERVIVNAGNVIHVKPLSNLYVLQFSFKASVSMKVRLTNQ